MEDEKDFMDIIWQEGRPALQNLPPVHVRVPAEGVEGQPPNYLFTQEDELTACLRYDEPFYGMDLWLFQEGSGMGESVVDPLPAAAAAGASSLLGGSTGTVTVTGEAVAPGQRPLSAEGRKQAGGGGPEEVEGHSEVVRLEQTNAKKPRSGTERSLRISRSADVHNRSEKKRRDKMNEKLKALQELIPRSTKADKASTLDDAIEYLKTLQQQVQMMSMGCGMVHTMFPCMSPGMGMSDPMLMYPANMVASAAFPLYPAAPASASFLPVPTHLAPPRVAPVDHQSNPMLSHLGTPNPMPQLPPHPNLAYPYQHHPGVHQTHYSP